MFIAIRLYVELIRVRRHYDENYVKAKNAISMECALGIFFYTRNWHNAILFHIYIFVFLFLIICMKTSIFQRTYMQTSSAILTMVWINVAASHSVFSSLSWYPIYAIAFLFCCIYLKRNKLNRKLCVIACVSAYQLVSLFFLPLWYCVLIPCVLVSLNWSHFYLTLMQNTTHLLWSNL